MMGSEWTVVVGKCHENTTKSKPTKLRTVIATTGTVSPIINTRLINL